MVPPVSMALTRSSTAIQRKWSSKVDADGFLCFEEAVFSSSRVIKMMEFDIEPLVLKSLMAKWRDEIERAIANVKRTAEDKRSRREWWRAGARRGWGRRAKG